MTPTWIAEEQIVFVHPDGRRNSGRIAVGLPVQGAEDARCPIALDGLQRCGPIVGDSTLQALLLAIQYLAMRLHDFRSKGGRVVYAGEAEDEDMPLEAFFGALLRDPTPPSDDEQSDP